MQIGHNVKIGQGSVIAGQAGLSGSTELGKSVLLGGQVGVSLHSKVGDGAVVMAQAGVVKDVEPGSKVSGYPAISARDWHRQTITLQRLVKNKN